MKLERHTAWRFILVASACVALCPMPVGAQGDPAVSDLVERIGEYVQQYFTAARTITAREDVMLQPLDDRLRPVGSRRRLVYDVRLEWAPEPGVVAPPRVVRHLVEMDGRPVPAGSDAACLAPESRDPLAFLLPAARARYVFGPVRQMGRDPVLLALDYQPVARGRPSMTWYGNCGVFDLPGLVRGRVFVSPQTFEVRRLETRLVGSVEIPVPEARRPDGWAPSITAERIDVRIDYAPVAFSDPEEVVLLPDTIDRVSVVHTPAPRRLRVTQRFSDYKRFFTSIRVLP